MYELGHLGLYKNVPKKRLFNSTPDYERDSYTLLQYKSHLRNEFLIPLKADGNGTGVATIRLQSTESQTINITGAGRFYTDAEGTTGESTSAVVGTSLTPLYVKLNEGSCYLVLTKADKLLGLGSNTVNEVYVITEATNAPFINGCNIGYKLHNLISIIVTTTSKSFFICSIDNCPNLIHLIINANKFCVITGSIDNCKNLVNLNIRNNLRSALTGTIDSCPNLSYLTVNGTQLVVFTGDIGKAVLCNYLNFSGNESPLTYVTRRSNWTSSLRIIHISSAAMTTEMIDNLFIDIDSSGVLPSSEKLINVNGLCAPVSSASLAARNSLVSKGFTLVYNNA
jgi:Leucine-rich repeat (LRR) protein